MSWVSRSTRLALSAYLLLATLILGGVIWGTIITIKLQRTEAENVHKANFQEHVRLAQGRMDSLLMPVVLREAARPYWEYSPYTHPDIYRLDGTEAIPDQFVQPSPLIDQPLPPWIKLHFQVDSYDNWNSPQVPTGDRVSRGATIPVVDPEVGAERLAILEDLIATHSYDALAGKVEQYGQLAIGGGFDYQTRCTSARCLTRFERESRLREEAQRRMQLIILPQLRCEPPSIALSNLFDQADYNAADGLFIQIAVSPMTAVWLDPDQRGHDQLAFVRTVATNIEGWELIQGFLVDWEILKQELVTLVDDLLSPVDFVPAMNAAAGDSDRLTSTFAIVAEPPPMPPQPWTATHLLLLVVWCAALAVLGGVGFGVRSLLTFTERRIRFAYAVTHELRTPLTTLRLYSDMLANGLVRPEDRDRYINTLDTESQRLSDLVDEVLEYARVENRRVKLDIRPVTVADLLQSIREHCDARCDKAGKQLSIESNGLAAETLNTDPQLVRQVVTNLVDNACKHARDAEDPTITVRAVRQHGGRIAFDVQDQGPGIDPAQKHNIFRPFRRAGPDDRHQPGGIGLGLALARSWAGLLNGRLELVTHSPHRPGTCFRLTIPKVT